MKMYRIFYDSHCPLCSREIELLQERCTDGSMVGVPIDSALEELDSLGISYAQAMTYLHIMDNDGALFVGMDALRLMYRKSGWKMQARVLSFPVVKQLADWGYPIFARNRYRLPAWLLKKPKCENGSCSLQQDKG